jgi:maleate isomerase
VTAQRSDVVTVGLIVPSSNLTIERTLARGNVAALMGTDVVVTRMPVVEISAAEVSRHQFTFEAMRNAALLLNDARPDVIAWTGTSGFWLGLAEERELLDSLSALVRCPVVSAAEGVIGALRQMAVTDVGVLTPYVNDVHAEVLASLRTRGFNIAADSCLGHSENFGFALIDEGQIETELERLAKQVRSDPPIPLAIICTNLAVPAHFDGVVVDSVIAILWFAATAGRESKEPYCRFHDRLVARLREPVVADRPIPG